MGELEAVKAGDVVVLDVHGYGSKPRKCLVVRVTNTQIIILAPGDGTDWRFRKDNGRAVGSTSAWQSPKIALCTPAMESAIQRHEALERIEKKQWSLVSTPKLLAVLAVLAQPESADAVDPHAQHREH